MSLQEVMEIYKIGTKIRLSDDDPSTIHEVCGYEWFADHASIIFKDGSKLNVKRLELIAEVA